MNPSWHDVLDARTVHDAGLTSVLVEGRDIALYALDDEIECPLHQGRFNVRSGQPMCAPLQRAVRVFPVRIVGGRVFVAIETATEGEREQVCARACEREGR